MTYADDDFPETADADNPDEDDSYEAAEDESDDADTCPHCGKPIYADAQQCPRCGEYISQEETRSRKPVWIVIGVILCLGMVVLWIL